MSLHGITARVKRYGAEGVRTGALSGRLQYNHVDLQAALVSPILQLSGSPRAALRGKDASMPASSRAELHCRRSAPGWHAHHLYPYQRRTEMLTQIAHHHERDPGGNVRDWYSFRLFPHPLTPTLRSARAFRDAESYSARNLSLGRLSANAVAP